MGWHEQYVYMENNFTICLKGFQRILLAAYDLRQQQHVFLIQVILRIGGSCVLFAVYFVGEGFFGLLFEGEFIC